MKPIDFDPGAVAEARAAARRYESEVAGLGVQFRAELSATLDRIRDNPHLYAAESGELRLAPVHRFAYAVVYEELADRIWIAAVAHQSRRPGYWSRRRPG